MQECLVALGSNLPKTTLTPNDVIEKAYELLECESVKILQTSRFFKTPAFPPGAGPDFVNSAVVLKTRLNPQCLMDHLHRVETQLGRSRNMRWEARTCDIDLLAYEAEILPSLEVYMQWAEMPLDAQMTRAPEQLILPHPRLAERGFVLAPLADVAADWIHPITGKSVRQMLADLPPDALEGVSPQAQ